MKAVLQRVSRASVSWDGGRSAIGPGIVVLVGVGPMDTATEASWLAEKCAGLRVFNDEAGKMNRSILDEGGEALVISQFTLYGDCRKGKRPSFQGAASPELAAPLVERFVDELVGRGVVVRTGSFGASMRVELVNEGPVTLIVESP